MKDKKTAYITGGSKGIGFGVAKILLENGYNVAISGRKEKDLEDALLQLSDYKDSVAGIEAANVAGMTSIGIGEASVLNEAKYNFNNFTEISTDFLVELINQ